jgi:hypothetical protein
MSAINFRTSAASIGSLPVSIYDSQSRQAQPDLLHFTQTFQITLGFWVALCLDDPQLLVHYRTAF